MIWIYENKYFWAAAGRFRGWQNGLWIHRGWEHKWGPGGTASPDLCAQTLWIHSPFCDSHDAQKVRNVELQTTVRFLAGIGKRDCGQWGIENPKPNENPLETNTFCTEADLIENSKRERRETYTKTNTFVPLRSIEKSQSAEVEVKITKPLWKPILSAPGRKLKTRKAGKPY